MFKNLSTRLLGASLALSVPVLSHAQAVDYAADGAAAVTGLVAGQSGYATPMFALALAATGIMIAVGWIKKSRGAAK